LRRGRFVGKISFTIIHLFMSSPRSPSFVSVTCPSCFQTFEVAGPAAEECPTEWDYDCEVCCRPMVIAFTCEGGDGDDVWADARGLND
jgi:hypothetical protein